MANKIIGKEYPLKEIFSKNFEFYIPPYQRPYAWSVEEASVLFEDLYTFYKTADSDDNYFLGSIVLKKEEDKPNADVIDGQQRLTTLTILLSVMCSFLTGKKFDGCYKYIQEEGDIVEGIDPKPRLHLREKDQNFFNKYIQNLSLAELFCLNKSSLKNEAQVHILENALTFKKSIEDKLNGEENATFEFLRFIINRCYLVAVCAPSQQSAFRVFSVMNSRGLDLLPIDIVKADIIGKIDISEQQHYTDKWEELETLATRDGFNEIFTHIRMMFAKSKAKKSLLEEFTEYVIGKMQPKELVDNYLEPCTNAYIHLKNRNYEAVKNAEQINGYLFWLNKIDNSDWMPVAIKFYVTHESNPDYMLWFFEKLERLASYLHATANDINHRIERYKTILDEMDRNPDSSMEDQLLSIELTNTEKREFMKCLDGDIYTYAAKRRNYIIMRLNDFVSDGSKNIDFSPTLLTIEHVLPQTVNPESEWERLWPDEEMRKRWLNRIANLVPLTRQKNSEAQNYDFNRKVNIYFKGKNGTTSYPLTTQVVMEKTWTPDLVVKRQKYLLEVLKKSWQLDFVDQQKKEINDDELLFYLNLRGSDACGYPDKDKFIVKKGSKISDDTVSSFESYYPNAYSLRKQLIEYGIIQNNIFTKDYGFQSLSLADSVVIGRAANGYTEWKDEDGIPFCDYDVDLTGHENIAKNDELRKEYWEFALPIIAQSFDKNGPFNNSKPTSNAYVDGYFDAEGIHLYCSVSLKPRLARAGIWISTKDINKSDKLYDFLLSHKKEIEEELGINLIWKKRATKLSSSISFEDKTLDYADKTTWSIVANFHAVMSKKLADCIYFKYENDIKNNYLIENT